MTGRRRERQPARSTTRRCLKKLSTGALSREADDPPVDVSGRARRAGIGRRILERAVLAEGYDQTNVLTGKGPSNHHEIFYFAEGTDRRCSHRRLEIPPHRPARRMARRDRQARLADPVQPSARSI